MSWMREVLLAVALLGLLAPPAYAEDEAAASGETATSGEAAAESGETEESSDEPVYDRTGFYLGAGGGWAFAEFDDGNADDSGVANVRAGYHFLRFGAAEAQFEYLPEFGSGSGKFAGVDTAVWGAWLNAKGYPTAPWTGRFQPYALFGIGWMWMRETGPAIANSNEDGAFGMRFGGGIDLYATENIVITADGAWVLPTGGLDDLKHVTVGGALQYRF
jgi:opacity protein-like surface antigen